MKPPSRTGPNSRSDKPRSDRSRSNDDRPPRRGNGKPVRGDDKAGKDKKPQPMMGQPHKVTRNHAFSAKSFGDKRAQSRNVDTNSFKGKEIGAGDAIKSSAKPAKKGKSGVYRSGFTARPTLLINLDAIKDNYDALQTMVGNVKIGASVKADAYGLGAPTVAKTLYGAGCRTFFVATAGEGKVVREAIGENASIYVLNGPAPQDLTLFFKFTLKPVINSIDQARMWTDEADRAKHAPFTALHIDTGMNRLGMDAEDTDQLSKNLGLFKALGPDLIMSHLACAPDAAHALNAQQLERFRKQSSRFPVLPLSLANTAGIYLGKPYHLQMVRPGIGLYGGQATTDAKQETSKPVVSLMAPVLQLREVKKGETIGYNASFTAEFDMKIAIVGAGYADGIPVSASSHPQGEKGKTSFASLQKQRVPIIGRVSMDTTILDVTRLVREISVGDWAEFRGENLQVDSNAIDGLNYELLVRLGPRCRKTYLRAGDLP